MKTALVTLALAVAFFGIGLGITRFVSSRPADAEAAEAEVRCADGGDVGTVAADLGAMRARLVRAEARADSLRRVLDRRATAADGERADAAELGATLAKLEGDDLAAVVQRLDGRSFVRLYQAASGRTRGRLLDALTPAQAAAFVRHQLPGGAAAHTAAPAAAKTAAPPAADSTTATR